MARESTQQSFQQIDEALHDVSTVIGLGFTKSEEWSNDCREACWTLEHASPVHQIAPAVHDEEEE
jgi:hypothetical protein